MKLDGKRYQKKIQQVLTEQGLWPSLGLNLEYPKPQYYNCEQRTNCKLYIKDIRYNSWKVPKIHTNIVECTKSRKYDEYITCKVQYTCISKKHCIRCTKPKGKYEDCEDLPSKNNSDGKFNIFLIKFSN